MPERDGNTLPSEQTRFNLQGRERRDPLASELLNIGLRGLNRVGRMPYALESHVFAVANKDYEQAVEAFRYGLYEAAMVMARATIDAALYSSKYTVIDKISGFEVDMGGGISSHSTHKGGIVSWETLDKEARVLGLSLKKRRELYKIRDRYGNLAAHGAARHMTDAIRYTGLSEEQRKQVKAPKWFIQERDAYQVLKRTARFLVYIRRTYAIRTLTSLKFTRKPFSSLVQ